NVGKQLNLRFVRTIEFFYDESEDEAQRIDDLLKQVKYPVAFPSRHKSRSSSAWNNDMVQNGILLIDKAEGPSSAQVVHRVKTVLSAKKVGRLGRLDSFALCRLLLGVNEGTKIADIFLHAPKSYRGIMVLGVETDTQDST